MKDTSRGHVTCDGQPWTCDDVSGGRCPIFWQMLRHIAGLWERTSHFSSWHIMMADAVFRLYGHFSEGFASLTQVPCIITSWCSSTTWGPIHKRCVPTTRPLSTLHFSPHHRCTRKCEHWSNEAVHHFRNQHCVAALVKITRRQRLTHPTQSPDEAVH